MKKTSFYLGGNKILEENTLSIETQRLILRKFTEEDIKDIFLIYGDKEVNKFLPWFPLETIEDASEYFINHIKNTVHYYAITLKEDNHPIGYVDIGNTEQSNDLGYGLLKEFWHKGITTEACIAIINRLQQLKFPYITATHDINNPNSGGVMKKIGMTYRYSFKELVQPKNFMVTFRLYQLNFDGVERTYTKYQEKHPSFIEQIDR